MRRLIAERNRIPLAFWKGGSEKSRTKKSCAPQILGFWRFSPRAHLIKIPARAFITASNRDGALLFPLSTSPVCPSCRLAFNPQAATCPVPLEWRLLKLGMTHSNPFDSPSPAPSLSARSLAYNTTLKTLMQISPAQFERLGGESEGDTSSRY